jgi:predicted transcriptional regulator of viral defense system
MQTYRQRLWDVAVGQYGYVTTEDARALEIPVVELGKLAARGRLKRVSRSVYRFDELPIESCGQYLEAVLRVGRGARLVGDAVLSLHDLALVNPRRITVGTPHRNRSTLPEWLQVVRDDTPNSELVLHEGIPSVSVATAIRQCIGAVMAERLLAAVGEAECRGLLEQQEVAELSQAIEPAG